MIAFDVYYRGKRLCRAGVGADGVVTANITWVGGPEKEAQERDDLFVHVGGLHSPLREHRRWVSKKLIVGDEVMVRIVSAGCVDKPRSRTRNNPKKERQSKEEYARRLAKELGWELREKIA